MAFLLYRGSAGSRCSADARRDRPGAGVRDRDRSARLLPQRLLLRRRVQPPLGGPFPKELAPWRAEVPGNLIPPDAAHSRSALHPTQLYSTIDGLILFLLLIGLLPPPPPRRRGDGPDDGDLPDHPVPGRAASERRGRRSLGGMTISQLISVGLFASSASPTGPGSPPTPGPPMTTPRAGRSADLAPPWRRADLGRVSRDPDLVEDPADQVVGGRIPSASAS